ncbi:hypothetical protein ElyMa_002055200 [Elysia marginata]|uniref:Uncharacterized protein n=1 Tax=Elysia marginata TaxID=1093978 RepID=A0AAV4F9A6_9GAST|nr:hypothetical protein ElyMa_002055200 [Elysia marginata]
MAQTNTAHRDYKQKANQIAKDETAGKAATLDFMHANRAIIKLSTRANTGLNMAKTLPTDIVISMQFPGLPQQFETSDSPAKLTDTTVQDFRLARQTNSHSSSELKDSPAKLADKTVRDFRLAGQTHSHNSWRL